MSDFKKVLKYWGTVEANYEGIGSLVMTSLFTQHPETQKMFPRFKDIPQGQLSSNAGVTQQGVILLKKIGELLKAQGGHAATLKPVSKIHAESQIPIASLKMVTEVVVKIMKDKANMDADGQTALRKVLGIIFADMEADYKELGAVDLC